MSKKVPWNKGLTKETDNRVKKYSKSLEGRIVTDEQREKISLANTGKKRSEDFCKALSIKLSGENNPFYGKKHSEYSLKIMSNIKKGKKYSKETNAKKASKGSSNPAYKDGYYMLREEHKTLYKKTECELKDSTCHGPLDLHHNPSLTRDNFKNWSGETRTLCHKHHMDLHTKRKGVWQSV